MHPGFDLSVPLIVIANFAEAHIDFLARAEDPSERKGLIESEGFHADRTLLWMGDPKMVIVSHPIAHAEQIIDRLGYSSTSYRYPARPSHQLCADILREPLLLQAIVEYAGPSRTLQVVPYATTPELLTLVRELRTTHGLEVVLPESPSPEALWIRDYIDSKSGFHHLAGRWLAGRQARPPRAAICRDAAQAAAVAQWFCSAGHSCIVKPDTGENGIGQVIIRPESVPPVAELETLLESNPFLRGEPITVEHLISPSTLSPSFEAFVPHRGLGEPRLTYMSEQVFREYGVFCGVLVCRESLEAPWYLPLAESGLHVAEKLQGMGYAGHFDMDAIVDCSDRAHPLEINARRTGGTHVHEFARFFFGPDYLDQVALLSHEGTDSCGLGSYPELLARIEHLLFPIDGAPRGIVLTVTSTLTTGSFGSILVAKDRQSVLGLQQELGQCLRQEQN